MTDTKPQIQEAEGTPSRINTKNIHVGTSYAHIQNQRQREYLREATGKNSFPAEKLG